MADAAVEFLLLNLKQLLVYNSDLISGVKEQVESLYNELSMLKAFLKDSTEKRTEYEIVKELVRQIRTVVYEAEDVIDTFVAHTALHRARSAFSKVIHGIDYPAKLRSVAKEIESIRKKVDELYRKQTFGFGVMQRGESSSRSYPPEKKVPVVEEENVVGFDEEAETVIARLNGGVEELEVVSVIGMGGLGKSTLARKVFTDPAVEYKFFIRAWVYVSQEYSRKEVFLAILNSLDALNDEMYRWSDDRLAGHLREQLDNKRYLLVIDDVWTTEAWNDLKMAFPKNSNRSRILLTSRNKEVALYSNPDSSPHHLRFLTEDESWELLEKKVFRKEKCPSELEELGKKIAKECGGLPLAIVVIAGLLMKKDKTSEWWERVAECVSSYVAQDPEQCMDILALSYKHLPYHLKACFLYFGVFPEDFEIPVWKLIQLWVAEGFIQQVGDIRLEDTAEEQLEDLVDRNLVMVEKRRSNGGIKTCRVHDMLHDLCLKEAEEEKFLQEIKRFALRNSHPSFTPTLNKYRRLCIHSNVLDYISSKPSGPHVRSFLCFASDQGELQRENTSFIHEAYKLVRVLDMRSVSLPLFPVKITQLVHLRYIAISGSFKMIPASFSEFWNLQTIIVETTSRDLKVEADIWKMLQLRHLQTNASSHLRGPPAKSRKNGKDPLVRSNLQTISTISPESCTADILARAPNLKKVGIQGKLATLVEEKGGSSMFDNLTKLDHLVTLKLLNNLFPCAPSKVSLPQLYKFPPNLKKLTLADTLLEWNYMSMLGILPKLEVLKLKDNAFTGEFWKVQDGGFRLLRVLQIGKTNLVNWEASGHHFPRLQRLVLKHCESLNRVPSGLAGLSSLQNIELYHASSTAVASAKKIQEMHQLGLAVNQLKLLIYPPEP